MTPPWALFGNHHSPTHPRLQPGGPEDLHHRPKRPYASHAMSTALTCLPKVTWRHAAQGIYRHVHLHGQIGKPCPSQGTTLGMTRRGAHRAQHGKVDTLRGGKLQLPHRVTGGRLQQAMRPNSTIELCRTPVHTIEPQGMRPDGVAMQETQGVMAPGYGQASAQESFIVMRIPGHMTQQHHAIPLLADLLQGPEKTIPHRIPICTPTQYRRADDIVW